MRRHLLRWAGDGPAYCPFIGDGNIAAGGKRFPEVLKHEEYLFPGLYTDRYVYGADLDVDRVAKAQAAIPNGMIRVADCDTWPFYDIQTAPFSIGDFDAWAEPYPSFRSFFENAKKADRLVLMFTDAHRMGVMVDGTHIFPDGSKRIYPAGAEGLTQRRQAFYFYLSKFVWPWFEDYIAKDSYRVLEYQRYLRGMLTYWGAAIERPSNKRGK